MKTLTVCNQKGGVGKTTVALLLADAAARAGMHVLLVDVDPQANATSVALPDRADAPTLADVLGDPRGRELPEVVRSGRWGFEVAPSSVALASKERNRRTADEHDLRRLLAGVGDAYDLAVVDTPPSLGVLTVNARVAADEYLVVADPTRFALDGIAGVMETAEVVRTYFSARLAMAGIVVNLVDSTLESRRRLAELRAAYDGGVLEPTIPRRVIVKEALAQRRSLWEFGAAKGADEISAGVDQLVDRVAMPHVG